MTHYLNSRTITAFCLGVLFTCALMTWASPAHADPNTYYLECITESGGAVSDVAQELRLGELVQSELLEGLDRPTVVSRLLSDTHTTWERAEMIVSCAEQTWIAGGPRR